MVKVDKKHDVFNFQNYKQYLHPFRIFFSMIVFRQTISGIFLMSTKAKGDASLLP